MRPAVRRWGGVLLLAILPCAGFAARPWPDTRQRIVAFSDQLPNSLNATQRWFAATHFAGCQKMLRSEIQALRAYNTNFLCLHYQLAVGAGPANFIIGDAWGSDWAYVNAQSNWFLRNASTQRVHQTQWDWDLMDVRYTNDAAVSGFPAYWISNCLARIAAAEDDGVFADSYTPDAYGFGQSSPTHPWLEDVDLCRANWVPALEQFGRAARAALGSNDFVFLPNLGGLVTGWLDMDYGVGHGGMIEGFAFWGTGDYFDPADWALQMDRALALARSNKIVICQAYPGEGSAQERMFATASYLLVKGSRTYLNLLATSDVALEYYPEYEIDLGGAPGALPAGAAALWNATWGVYRRDYSNGIVLVNPSAAAVNIASLGTNYWRVTASGGGVVNTSGSHGGTLATALVSSLNLPAHSGAVLLFTNPFIPTGREFYVATNGNNAAAGSSAQPWRTPGFASRQLVPGDTLIIRGGRYIQSVFDADIMAPASGRADAWITIRGEEGNRPVLAGRSNLYASVILGGRSFVRLENLEITHDTNVVGAAGYFREGINILGAPASTNLVLNNLYIHHLDEFGLDAQDVDGLTVTNCRIEYCGFGAIGGPAGAAGGLRNLGIRNSRLACSGHYYQGGDGATRPYDRPDGFGIEASAGPVEIMDTVAEHNYGDGLDSKAARTTIRRCIVANNSCDGVKLWDGGSRVENTLIYGRGDGDATPTPWSLVVIANPAPGDPRFEFVNVTVADQHAGNYLLHAQYDYPAVPLDLLFRNCIFQSVDSPIYIGSASSLAVDHNLFHAPGRPAEVLDHGAIAYTSGNIATLGTGNLYGDPLFRAPAWGVTGDFQLRSNSPAINLGTATGAPADDLNRQLRSPPPDAGAYEWYPVVGLTVTPVTQAVGAASGTTTFEVSRTGTGTVAYAAGESESWLTISGGGSGTNSGTIEIAYDANETTSVRTGLVTVAGGGEVCTGRVVQAAGTGFAALRINCGGGATGEWVADTGYSGGTAKSTTSAIADATDAPQVVYQTRRYAPTLTYSFPDVPDGTYTIRLHFAELYYNAAGRRIFNVSIEGDTKLANFDIFQAAGGKNRAVVRTFENVAVSGGLQIQGVASADGAQFSGIEIESAGPPVPAIVTTAAQVTVPEGSTATFGVHLDTAPADAVTVTVARASGDADLSVFGGTSLVFTAANYAIDQIVTLAAAEDADTTAGTVTIQCAASGYTDANVTATEQDNDSPPYSAKINCGGGALAEGWLADSGYSGGTAKSTTSAIGNATNAPQAVYQTRRYAPTLTYSFPAVPDGTYTIRLHFAELYCNAAGRRIFTVSIEGQTRLTNFDIYQEAGGKNRALVKTFASVAVTGGLQIQGVALVDGAQFNGIEIESAGPAAPSVVVSSGAVTVPEGSTATFGVHLDTAPAGATTVTVTRASGDADLSVFGGTSLIFTAANYATDQTVTLAAAEDADTAAGTATIQCTASGYTAASVTATEQDNDSPPYSAKINCGGGALAGGWLADSGYSGGTAKSTTSAIANATNAPQAVYQTRRYAPTLTYSFPEVPDGIYTIRLHFAELYCNAAGRRIFNVSIEGQTRLTNFDIYQAAGGKYRAVVRTFENVVVSGGLQIQGVGSVDGAQFNGIEILASGGTRRSVAKASPMTAINWRGPDTVLSSEDAQTSGAGWAAVDGDLETVWRAAGSWGSWICLGYEKTVTLRAVDVQFTPESPAVIFTLASDDADNWFELEPELELGPVEANYLWFIFPAAPWAPPAAVREIELQEP